MIYRGPGPSAPRPPPPPFPPEPVGSSCCPYRLPTVTYCTIVREAFIIFDTVKFLSDIYFNTLEKLNYAF
jgi:hypothetical protein